MTSKERFQLNEVARARFQAIIQDPLVEQAMDAALIEMTDALARHDSPEIGNNNYRKILGARQFIATLQSLPLKTESGPKKPFGTLEE